MPILRMAFSRDRREVSLLLFAEHLKLLFRGRRVRFFDVLRDTRTCLAWRPRRSADFQICCIAGFQPADASRPAKPRHWRRLCRLEIGDTAGWKPALRQRVLKDTPGIAVGRTKVWVENKTAAVT